MTSVPTVAPMHMASQPIASRPPENIVVAQTTMASRDKPYPPFTPPEKVVTLAQLHEQKAKLQEELGDKVQEIQAKSTMNFFFKSVYFTAFLVFIFVGFLLFAFRPSVVMNKDADTISIKKVAAWSTIAALISLIVPALARFNNFRLPNFLRG